MNPRRLWRVVPAALLLGAAACGQTPQTTEKARGVLSGVNVVLALTVVFLVVAVGIVVGALALDRIVRSRKELASAPPPPDEEEEQDEVMAGIAVGRAGVPRWLYGFYVIIPLFAMLYVVNNVSLRPAESAKKPVATPKPTGPQTKVTIAAKQIKFDLDKLIFPPNASVTVTFDNEDAGVPHTLTVWKSQSAAQSGADSGKLADTGQFTGVAQKVLPFKTPGPGNYYFDCTVHPTSMFGTVEVVAK
jgi:plastocyanin